MAMLGRSAWKMLFGSKSSFAIEAFTEGDLTPPSAVWGRMCLWCHDTMIGRLSEEYCALFTSAKELRSRADNLDELWDKSFDGLRADQIFRIFDRAIYVYDESAPNDLVDGAERYWKFNFLTNWGEQFDRLKGFLAAPPGEELLLIIQGADDSLTTFSIGRDSFRRAAIDFADWFDREEQRLRPNLAEQAGGGQAATRPEST